MAEGIIAVEASQQQPLHFRWCERTETRDSFDRALTNVAVRIVEHSSEYNKGVGITRGTERLYDEFATIGIEPRKGKRERPRGCTATTPEDVDCGVAQADVFPGFERVIMAFTRFGAGTNARAALVASLRTRQSESPSARTSNGNASCKKSSAMSEVACRRSSASAASRAAATRSGETTALGTVTGNFSTFVRRQNIGDVVHDFRELFDVEDEYENAVVVGHGRDPPQVSIAGRCHLTSSDFVPMTSMTLSTTKPTKRVPVLMKSTVSNAWRPPAEGRNANACRAPGSRHRGDLRRRKISGGVCGNGVTGSGLTSSATWLMLSRSGRPRRRTRRDSSEDRGWYCQSEP